MIGYGFPILLALIPLLNNDYGPNPIFCWIENPSRATVP